AGSGVLFFREVYKQTGVMIAMLSDLTFNGCDDLVCYLPDTKALHICRWFFFFSVREDPANAVVPRKIGIRFIQLRINVRSAIFIRQCQDKFTPIKLILI